MAKSEKITAAMRLKSSMPTLAQPTAELWNTIFNVVLVLGAIAVLAGTWGAFWTGNMKEFYSNARISANEAQTASANAAAEQAREGAATANERAGRANEVAAGLQVRAGLLEKDAAEARLEQEKLKAANLNLEARIAPRHFPQLTPAQTTNLRPFIGKTVKVGSYALDVEGASLATQILNVLQANGLSIVDERLGDATMGGMALGIWVDGPDSRLVAVLRDLLRGAQLAVTVGTKPAGGGMSMSSGAPFDAFIFVGAKPIPQ